MKKIMLLGKSNSGKTTTLNYVYEKIMEKSKVIEERIKIGGDENDFCCILEVANKKIAIFSLGDFAYFVLFAIELYNAKSCDYLIFACNSNFSKPRDKMEKSDFIIEKEEATDTDNQKCVKDILQKINL